MKRRFIALAVLAAPALLSAQTGRDGRAERDLATTISTGVDRPGRAAEQPIDSAYTRKIREYTTESFFLSPLVDYLPASATVPTPMATLGDIAGAKDKLPYSKEVYAYMRLLASKSPRVRVFSIGTTEEGREMIAVAVANEALIAKLDENRAKLAQLADPRTLGMDDAKAAALVNDVTPVYYVTGTIHSTESGAPTALMELAYRLAVDESPYVKHIRDNVITLITPIVEVDGRDRMVDLFRWHMAHPNDTYPNLLYWGHYVAHDNNRDAMAMTLKLSQNVMNAFVSQKAQVLHDLHESGSYLYDNTVGDGPYNAWLDPLLTNEWQMLGWNNVQEMTRLGMPGVYTHGNFDTWSPGYLMFMAATHNGISRLYETFGNGGTAETIERTLGPDETSRTWYRQNPPLPRVMWSLRNNNNYEQTGLLVSLNYFATNKKVFLQNFWEKSKRSILKARTEGPAAYVLPSDERRPGAQAELLRVMQKQHVEIVRGSSAFTVSVPVRPNGRGAGSGSRGAGTANSTTTESRAPTTETRTFPAGSYIIRMDQPYSRIADALLDYQYWSPNDPQKTPYDDTGWTFPEGFAVTAVRVTDPKVLDVPATPVTDTVRAPGGVSGSGAVVAIDANGDAALTTLRYKLKAADIQAAEEPFESGGRKFTRGSFLVRGVPNAELDRAMKSLGVQGYALDAAPNVKTHPVRAARVAILHTWLSTQTEGWWRQAFDAHEIPYDYISVQDVAKTPNLAAKWDVILFPPSGGAGQQIIDGIPMWRNPMPWKVTPETPNMTAFAQTDDIRPGLGWQGMANLQSFVNGGGVLVGVNNTAEFAAQYGLAQGVTMNHPRRGTVTGSLLRTKLVDDASPLTYGVVDNLAVYSDGGESFSVSLGRGGRGGRFAGLGGQRETGRGTSDDPDVPQGRPVVDPRNQAPAAERVEAWQLGTVSPDALRNPTYLIPPDQRPRVALRFSDQRELLASGLLDGGSDIAQRPAVVDVPVKKGHVVLFANNPVYRGETVGSYPLVLNAMLHWDNLGAGRKVDVR